MTSDPTELGPVPVAIVAPDPIPVVLADGDDPRGLGRTPSRQNARGEQVQRQATDPSKPANTTFQQDLTSAGQRTINVMWEGTQKYIALGVVGVSLVVLAYLIVAPGVPTELRLVALSTLSNVLFAVTSVYFTRTNHTKTGGVSADQIGR